MNEYEERKQARIGHYRERAANARRQADSLHNRAHEMASIIPLGQPILVGHHSERRDRNYRARIQSTFEKAFGEHDKANHYEEKAIAAESNHAISGDDPDALPKLREKLAALKATHAQMLAINKAHRAFLKNPHSLEATDFSEAIKTQIRQYVPQYSWEPNPIAPYQLQNSTANIKRVEQRIADLERRAVRVERPPAEAITGDGWRIEDHQDDNRVWVTFDSIPSAEIRKALKSAGFKWSPTRTAWIRSLSTWSTECAKRVLQSS